MENPSHHLASYLSSYGYETALAGIQHEAKPPWSKPEELGYQHWLNHNEDGTPVDHSLTPEAAVSYLERSHDKPFFLSVGFVETHRKSAVPEGELRDLLYTYDKDACDCENQANYCRPPAWMPDTPRTRRDWANFLDGARRLDAKAGTVLDAIERLGYKSNTLIILTTDHGIAWPGAKANLTDAGIGVMLMIAGPEGSGFEAAKVIDGMVTHLDLYPTICESAGIPLPEWIQGRSLTPLALGEVETLHSAIFAEHGYEGHNPQRAVRTERYKYIRRVGPPYYRIADNGPANEWFRELGFSNQPDGNELLYDLYFDPMEQNNIASNPDYAEALKEMSLYLDQWIQNTADPFPNVPPPPKNSR